ncbi:hypothetical protein AMTRI_Chr06g178050 [Amborella trichopoda]
MSLGTLKPTFIKPNCHDQTMHHTCKDRIDAASTSQLSESGDLAAGKWVIDLILGCAKAITEKDAARSNHLLWMLNELASPYGDRDQRKAAAFLQALFCKASGSGDRCSRILAIVAEKAQTFDSARRVILRFQEVSPWTTFGHVAANGAILEAFEGVHDLHIIDISNTLCTQWPALLEALANRSEDTPRLRLTTLVDEGDLGGPHGAVMIEVRQRMEKYARLMRVPFEFEAVGGGLGSIGSVRVTDSEVVAVNLVGALRRVPVDARPSAVHGIAALGPRVVTVVEEEADLTGGEWAGRVSECMRFYGTYYEMLDEGFGRVSEERLALERQCGRELVHTMGCESAEGGRERSLRWSERMRNAGFGPAAFNFDAIDDVRALLKRYAGRWSVVSGEVPDTGLYLSWKDQPVVWASAWKP